MSEGIITGISATGSGATAYIDPDDFRTATAKWYTTGILLTTAQAGDTILEQTIAHVSQQLDEWTGDHFLPEEASIDLRGTGGTILTLPRRTRSISALKTRDHDGVLTAEASTAYRLCSSLNSDGTDFSEEHIYDYVEMIPQEFLNDGTGVWPAGNKTVQVTGAFGWAATPEAIKRACALAVWNILAAKSPEERRASEWSTKDARYVASDTLPTGLPEADTIIKQFTRPVWAI